MLNEEDLKKIFDQIETYKQPIHKGNTTAQKYVRDLEAIIKNYNIKLSEEPVGSGLWNLPRSKWYDPFEDYSTDTEITIDKNKINELKKMSLPELLGKKK